MVMRLRTRILKSLLIDLNRQVAGQCPEADNSRFSLIVTVWLSLGLEKVETGQMRIEKRTEYTVYLNNTHYQDKSVYVMDIQDKMSV